METVLNAYRNLSVTDMDEEDAVALNSSGAKRLHICEALFQPSSRASEEYGLQSYSY